MAMSEDLINFDLIEEHKENIQQLPSGRSAKQLASILSPRPSAGARSAVTLEETKTLNDAIRKEYEIELQGIEDSDDPLDIFDRYVKWTLNAYPSAQSTPQSQLLPLLERATNAFLNSTDYKNDPRYLKLWLHYIRLFSDTPRETFAFLARHNVGEHLALYYEEFAAWLESAERWNQADEVFNMGIEREARPSERLMRKYKQFQQRYQARPDCGDEPSSPALPKVRAALAAKFDPFASTDAAREPQQQQSRQPTAPAAKTKKAKMAIFSDADAPTPPSATPSATSGWDSIGSMRERRKENTIEAQPWAGQTLKAGKKVGTSTKMEVFKDPNEMKRSKSSRRPEPVINPKTGRAEQVFVDMDEVYTEDGQEFSFEELRAVTRGWSQINWRDEAARNSRSASAPKLKQPFKSKEPEDLENLTNVFEQKIDIQDSTAKEGSADDIKSSKLKKTKIREVKQETQTVKLRDDAPKSKPKPRRKVNAEPTMTFNSKAAHSDIYEMYNNASKQDAKDEPTQSGVDTDFEDDTFSVTGKFSTTNSEFGDETVSSTPGFGGGADDTGTSPWSDYTTGKLSKVLKQARSVKHSHSISEDNTVDTMSFDACDDAFDTQAIAAIANQNFGDMDTIAIARLAGDNVEDLTGVSDDDNAKEPNEQSKAPGPEMVETHEQSKYVPVPPEDYEPTPMRPYWDPALAAQNKLPFMTPIVERTESSLAAATVYHNQFTATKTPRSSIDKVNEESPSKLDVLSLLLESPQPRSAKSKSHNESEDVEKYSPKKLVAHSPMGENQKILFPVTKPTADVKSSPIDSFKTPAPARSVPAAKKIDRPIHKGPIINDLICNPCDDSVMAQILKIVHPAPASYSGFHEYEDQAFNHFSQIRAFARKQSKQGSKASPKKGLSDSARGPMPTINFLGSNRVYAVKRELGEGAFAPVYLVESAAKEEGSDKAVAVRGDVEALKAENEPKTLAWEFHILHLAKSRLGRSSRAMQSIVIAQECHLYRDECYLVLDYHNQGTLLNLVNLCRNENVRAGKTPEGLEEPVVMWLAVELLRTMEDLHKVGILHGDLKADNCLVRFDTESDLTTPYNRLGENGWSQKGLTLIDFGRGIDTRAFKPEAKFIADWDAEQTDCPEIREAKPWKWEIDMFGAAGVIHSLLFGKYIDTVSVSGGGLGQRKEWKLRESFKRYWQKDIWTEVFNVLINGGGKKDDEVRKEVQRVRGLMEDWLEAESERNGCDLRGSIRRCERLIGVGASNKTKR